MKKLEEKTATHIYCYVVEKGKIYGYLFGKRKSKTYMHMYPSSIYFLSLTGTRVFNFFYAKRLALA